MEKLSSARTQSGTVSRDNRTDGLDKGRSIISRLKSFLWTLLNMPVRVFIFFKDAAFSFFNKTSGTMFNKKPSTISPESFTGTCRFPKGSKRCEVNWRNICDDFRSSATQDSLKAMNTDEKQRNYQDYVNELVDKMNSNMKIVEAMEVALQEAMEVALQNEVLPISSDQQHYSIIMELSPVTFETMLQQIKKGDVIEETLLNDAKSFVDLFDNMLDALEKTNTLEYKRVEIISALLYVFNKY